MSQTFAKGPVPYLIVSLHTDNKPIPRQVADRSPMLTSQKRTVATVVNECVVKCLHQLSRWRVVIRIITVAFAGQQGMDAMMKIIIPLSVQAIAPLFRWPQ